MKMFVKSTRISASVTWMEIFNLALCSKWIKSFCIIL